MLHRIFPLVCFAILSGCVSAPVVTIESTAGTLAVPKNEKLCLSTPKDGRFDGRPYRNSGAKVAKKIRQPIDDLYVVLSVGYVPGGDFTECVQRGGKYILVPEILEYENRATGWSGRLDKIKVQVDLVRIGTSEKSSFTYYATSDLVTSAFLEWGNAPPYDLLAEEFQTKVRDLVTGSR